MKRKAEDELPSISKDRHSMAINQVTIDPDGDLRLYFKIKGHHKPLTLLVNRYTLCLSSSVFREMLSVNLNGKTLVRELPEAGGIPVFPFDDEDFDVRDITAMIIVMKAIHLQSHRVPREVKFDILHKIARLCDKYDLLRSLGPWPEVWSKFHEFGIGASGYDEWLYIATVFKNEEAYTRITKKLILETKPGDLDELVPRDNNRLSKDVPACVLGSIIEARHETLMSLLQLCWDEMHKMRKREYCDFRGTGSEDDSDLCEIINLGLFTQQFPDRSDMGELNTPEASVLFVLDSIREIEPLHSLWPLLKTFVDKHVRCNISARLVPLAMDYLDTVEGLKLETADNTEAKQD